MELTLYHYWRSSASWRVRLALCHKGIPCQYQAVNLLASEQKSVSHEKINPARSVPVLEVKTGTKPPLYLAESLAIIEWLNETYPQQSVLPQEINQRALVRQMAQTISSGIHPLQNLKVLQYFSNEEEQKKLWARHWIEEGLSIYEKLCQIYAGDFSFANEVTLADICLVPQIYNARRFAVDLTPFKKIQEITEKLSAMDFVKKSHPDIFST